MPLSVVTWDGVLSADVVLRSLASETHFPLVEHKRRFPPRKKMLPFNGKERLMCLFLLARSHTVLGSLSEPPDPSLSIKYKIIHLTGFPIKPKSDVGKKNLLLAHRRSSRIGSAVPKEAVRKEEESPHRTSTWLLLDVGPVPAGRLQSQEGATPLTHSTTHLRSTRVQRSPADQTGSLL